MPSIHIPDKYAYEIVKLGLVPRDFVKTAVKEKLKKMGVNIDDSDE